jgi:arylsulfatase A-like enzyme
MQRKIPIVRWLHAVTVLILAGTLLTASNLKPVPSHAPEPAGEGRLPNIVILLVDDLGWIDLATQGSRFYRTPQIDRLAEDGMRFTAAYASCAVCSPTRASIQTGRYPARIGVTDWIRALFQGGDSGHIVPADYVGTPEESLLCPPNPFAMPLSELTFAEALRAAGYVSCHIGKWHLGTTDFWPTEQGYSVNIAGCDYGQPPSYFDPYVRGEQRGFPTMNPRREGEYLTDRLSDEAVNFIREHKDQPFVLNMDYYAVHTPLMGKPELIDQYEGKSWNEQDNPIYAAMVQAVDDATGKILRALEEAGVAQDTLVIFTSDNGGLLGSTSNLPLRAGKGWPYEGGIRVPLIIRWPGVVRPGVVCPQPVSSIDLFPTILEAARVPMPSDRVIDGVSLVPLLRSGGQVQLPARELFWHFPHYRSQEIGPYSIVRDGRWKLIRWYEGPLLELYDLESDPGEARDLAQAMPDQVRRLNQRLTAGLEAQGARLPRRKE